MRSSIEVGGTPRRRWAGVLWLLALGLGVGPAARAEGPLLDGAEPIRMPRGLKLPPEQACLPPPSDEKLGDDEVVSSAGLSIEQIQAAVEAFLPKLDECVGSGAVPRDVAWFDLTVGCNGRVEEVDVIQTGDWRQELVACVRASMRYIAFPAHGLPDGELFQQPIGFVSNDKAPPPPAPPVDQRPQLLSGDDWGGRFPRSSDAEPAAREPVTPGSQVGVTVVAAQPPAAGAGGTGAKPTTATPPARTSSPDVAVAGGGTRQPAPASPPVVVAPATPPTEPTAEGTGDAVVAVEVEPVDPQVVEGVARPSSSADVGMVGPGTAAAAGEAPVEPVVEVPPETVAAVEPVAVVAPVEPPVVSEPSRRGRRGRGGAAPAVAASEPVASEPAVVRAPAAVEPSVAASEPVATVQAPSEVEPAVAAVAAPAPVVEPAVVAAPAPVVEPAAASAPVEPAPVAAEPVAVVAEPAVAPPAAGEGVEEPVVAAVEAVVEPVAAAPRASAVAQRARRILRKERAIFPEPLVLLHGSDPVRCDARVEVDAKGRPLRIALGDCPAGLHLAARDALEKWRWEAREKDAPVEVQPARVAFVRLERPYSPGATYLADPDVVLGALDGPVLLRAGTMPSYPANVSNGDFVCAVSAIVSRSGKTKTLLIDECPVPFREVTSKAVKRWTWFVPAGGEQEVTFHLAFQLTQHSRRGQVPGR